MERQAIDAAQHPRTFAKNFSQKVACPEPFVGIGAGSDESQFVAIGGQPGSVAAEFRRVLFRRKVAAAAPGFIADAPKFDAKRFDKSAGGAQFSQGGAACG